MNEKYMKQVALLVKCLPFVEQEECFAIKGGTAINLFRFDLPRLSVARASFQRNAGLFAIAREGCLSGLQRES